jgi:hypothetical protein
MSFTIEETIYMSLVYTGVLFSFNWNLNIYDDLIFNVLRVIYSIVKLGGAQYDLVNRCGISVTNDHGYVPLVVSNSMSFPYS